MPKDVIITPASGNVEFRQASGNTEGLIELTDDGFLKITSTNSGVLLGDSATDIYIGDGVTSVDLIFEQDGDVRALTGKTLTLGQSDSTVRVNASLQITNSTLVANLNADLLDGLNSTSFANAAFANTDFTTISATAGVYGNASHVPVTTLAANGRISSIVNTSVAIAASQVTSGTLPIARGGTNATTYTTGAALQFNGTSIATLANTGTAGTYANATHVPVITTDAYGRVSAVTNTTISFPVTSVAGVTGAVSNTQLINGIIAVDGAGSGLDADLLDGLQGASYANAAFAQAAFNKANSSAQLAFTTVSANGTSVVADANNDTLTITAATANGVQIIGNATTDTIDFGLRPSGVVSGTYGNSSTILTLTIDQFGRITQVTSNTVTAVETDPLALAFAIALG
jgi:hypothetical protein